MNSLERWYRWATDPRLPYGLWGTRFMLPAIPILIISVVMFASGYSAVGAVGMGAVALWAFTFVGLAIRDISSVVAALMRKVLR